VKVHWNPGVPVSWPSGGKRNPNMRTFLLADYPLPRSRGGRDVSARAVHGAAVLTHRGRRATVSDVATGDRELTFGTTPVDECERALAVLEGRLPLYPDEKIPDGAQMPIPGLGVPFWRPMTRDEIADGLGITRERLARLLRVARRVPEDVRRRAREDHAPMHLLLELASYTEDENARHRYSEWSQRRALRRMLRDSGLVTRTSLRGLLEHIERTRGFEDEIVLRSYADVLRFVLGDVASLPLLGEVRRAG
jgi:hypothetical protein